MLKVDRKMFEEIKTIYLYFHWLYITSSDGYKIIRNQYNSLAQQYGGFYQIIPRIIRP